MLILLYKSLFFTKYPIYMRNMFSVRDTSYNLHSLYVELLLTAFILFLTMLLNNGTYYQTL